MKQTAENPHTWIRCPSVGRFPAAENLHLIKVEVGERRTQDGDGVIWALVRVTVLG